MILDREVKILFRKEWRMLTSSRGAMAGALILPIVGLLITPMLMMFTIGEAGPGKGGPAPDFGLFAEVGNDPRKLSVALLPLMIAMVGVIVPTMLMTFLVISERESRTLELLVALPVRIDQILRAKLLAVVVATAGGTVPLVVIDCVVAASKGLAPVSDVLGLPFMLVCVLAYSTSASLLVALLSRDFRAANNIAGLFMVPALFLSMAGTAVLPGGWVRPVVLGLLFALGSLLIARSALKSASFERLIS
ncbi:MAG: ABC transporter permease subunit [Myxococcales bacterium]|nr:ABC transporter permease subunit [Myxococcales bacterium]